MRNIEVSDAEMLEILMCEDGSEIEAVQLHPVQLALESEERMKVGFLYSRIRGITSSKGI